MPSGSPKLLAAVPQKEDWQLNNGALITLFLVSGGRGCLGEREWRFPRTPEIKPHEVPRT